MADVVEVNAGRQLRIHRSSTYQTSVLVHLMRFVSEDTLSALFQSLKDDDLIGYINAADRQCTCDCHAGRRGLMS